MVIVLEDCITSAMGRSGMTPFVEGPPFKEVGIGVVWIKRVEC